MRFLNLGFGRSLRALLDLFRLLRRGNGPSPWAFLKDFRRVVPYLRPHKRLAGGSMLMVVASTGAALLAPWPLAILVDTVLGNKPLPSLVGFLGGLEQYPLLLVAVLGGLVLTALVSGLAVVDNYINTKLDQSIVLDIRTDLFAHAQRLSLAYHDNRKTGQLMYQINTQASAAGQVTVAIPPVIQSVFTLLGMFFIVYRIEPLLAVLAVTVVPFIYASAGYYTRRIEPQVRKVRQMEGDSLSIVHEAMAMMRVIVAFGREKHEHTRFRTQAEEAVDARVRLTVRQTVFSLVVTVITAIGTALVLGYGAHTVIRQGMTTGELLVVMGYIGSMYKPLEQISNTVSTLQEQFISLQGAFELLDAPCDIEERPGAIDVGRVAGRVRFEGVGFNYAGRVGTLEQISFDADAGQTVAIVGPTGAGKSTLLNLLPRFYDPGEGRVLLDGRDVRDLTLTSLRAQISVVLQEPLLFSGSIEDNIRYGRMDATTDEVVEAARAANAHDFIASLPEAYATVLGERGSKLSGGERQRISVARAFLKDAPVLILDEPTSSIDSKTEAVILDALERLAEGRTTFIVAHRLSTLSDADLILVVNHGRIVEQGGHDELMGRSGLYHELFVAQQGAGRRRASAALSPEDLSRMTGAIAGGREGGRGLSGPPLAELARAMASRNADEAGGATAAWQLLGAAWPLLHDGSPERLRTLAHEPAGDPGEAAQMARHVLEDLGLGEAPPSGQHFRPASKRVVVLGMMSQMPVAGVVWQTLHYLLGLRALGFDPYYVEAHARTPSMLMRTEDDNGGEIAAAFIDRVMRRFDLGDRWAFHALHDDGRCYGLSEGALRRLYASATLLINLHGGTEPLPEMAAHDRLVYVETDPVQLEVELAQGVERSIAFLEPHAAYFTFAENLGQAGCALPVSDRFRFQPTRQPVVLDLWHGRSAPQGTAFTTIGNWRQRWRDVSFDSRVYSWSKHLEFRKVLDLPALTGAKLELALASYEPEDRVLLERHGWRVRHALDFSTDLDAYRDYVVDSRAEFSVAKEQNVVLRTGWFSDRSATYLAAGRPVIVQDTGISSILPTGDGLLVFSTLEEAAEAVLAVEADPERHAGAATEIAREHFDATKVLAALVEGAGVPLPAAGAPAGGPLPETLDLRPASRRPLALAPETIRAVRARPVPAFDGARRQGPVASLVMVTYDGLPWTRMALESILASSGQTAFELLVVDNASDAETRRYLHRLADANEELEILESPSNAGFPAAVNRGLEAARGGVVGILNNDIVVAPGWLEGLLAHLDDPTVGLVGPATNRIDTGSEVPTTYATYGAFLAGAATAREEHRGVGRDVDMLAFFCALMRREVYERIGGLDEQFGIGLLEDDDYSRRVQAAGLRTVCAEDVLVHHFGEASFGALVPTGERNRLLERNLERFERKWGAAWQPYDDQPDPDYEHLRERVRRLVAEVVPRDAGVLVVSRGDEHLVDLGGRRAGHFPQADGGVYAGHYPADSAEAVRHLEQLQADGGEFLVLPSTGFWWLEHYTGLREHLEGTGEVVARDEGCCVIYALGQEPA